MNRSERSLSVAMRVAGNADDPIHKIKTRREVVQFGFMILMKGVLLDSMAVNKRTMRIARNFDKH